MIIDKAVTSPATLQFSLKAQELKKRGREIISLGLGEPDFETPEHIKEAAIEALHMGFTRYSAAQGLLELRELVAKKLYIDNGIDASPDEIIITPGAKNALYLACAASLRPGDEVINFSPCCVSNIPVIKIAEPQAVIHDACLTGLSFSIDKQKVESLINSRTKLIMINYPNNPTGKMMTPDDVEFIVRLVRDNDLYLLSDEIYEKIIFSERKHISPAAFKDIGDKVITVNGFSKAYAMTGWRIGYVHANKELTATMLKLHQQLNTNTAAFIQKGAIAALTGPQTHIDEFIANLKVRKGLYNQLISESAHLKGSDPEGGFFGFIDISSTDLPSDEFCARLLEETGVAIIPGVSFGSKFDGFCRVSLVNKTELIAEAFAAIHDFVDRWANR